MLRRLWNRLLCRTLGHRLAEITHYQPGLTRVGVGCTRHGCPHGTVHAYRGAYPLPRDRVTARRLA